MIPIHLRLKGIYSYREEQQVDFSKLMEGQIFGIFGSVGSGKSTILEAISFALYDDTERLLKSGDNRYYNMMNLKSDELEVDFVFKMREEEEYRALIRGKRNKKNFEKVDKFERSLYRKVEGEWKPTSETAEEIIGLSYDNFRRTIIIPQGKFEEFLRLSNTHRTRMMKEIFNLGKYDLGFKLKGLETKNLALLHQLQGNLEQLSEVSKEVLAEAKKELKAKEKEGKAAEKELKKLQKELAETEELKEDFAAAASLAKEFEALQGEAKHYADLAEQIKQTRHCREHFAGKFQAEAELLKEQEVSNKETERVKAEIAFADRQKKEKAEVLRKVKAVYDKREEEKDKAEELRKIVKINALEQEAEKCRQRFAKGKEYLTQVVQKIKEQQRARDKQAAELKQMQSARPDTRELTELQLWFATEKNIRTEAQKAEQKRKEAEETYKKTGARFSENFEQSGCVKKDGGLKAARAEIQATSEAVKQEIEAAEKVLWQEKEYSGLAKAAHSLEDGKACPVCGATEHPEPLNSKENRQKIADAEFKIKSLQERKENLETCLRQADTLIAVAEEQHKSLQNARKQEEEIRATKEAHLQAFPGKTYSREQEKEVLTAIENLQKFETELRQKQEFLEKITAQIRESEQAERKYSDGLAGIKTQLASAEGKGEELSKQIKILALQEFSNQESAKIEAQAEQILQHVLSAEKQFSLLDKEIDELERKKSQSAGILSQLEKQNEGLAEKIGKIQQEITQGLTASDYENRAAVQAVLSLNLDTEKAETQYRNYQTRLTEVRTKHESLQVRLQGKNFDPVLFKKQKEDTARAEDNLSGLQQTIGAQQNKINRLEADLKVKQDLRAQNEAVQKRKLNIDTLKKLFRKEGFVNFVSSVYLRNLCEAANQRFAKLTKQQLRLELNADNTFDVRDYLNDGKVRSAKTLSGGQTFQAALSLALALAESVQKQNRTEQNFFFLDEGFGTQDRESLQAVFEALKSLRKENRVVGVISHVEELQQEIDVNLRIEKDEERGSQIKVSWA